MGIGDWGLGIGEWGLGPIPNPQSPIPKPPSPIPLLIFIHYIIIIKLIINLKIYLYYKNKILFVVKLKSIKPISIVFIANLLKYSF